MYKLNPKFDKYIAKVKNKIKRTQANYANNTFNYGPNIKPIGTYNDLNAQTYHDIKPYLTKYKVAIDIGARWGEWSRMLLEDFDHVYCFEPLESRYKYLPLNCKMDNITLYGCCLGDKQEDVDMYGGCVYNDNIDNIDEIVVNKNKVTKQHSIRLDDLNINNVEFIKIDVEGYELPVLKGAIQTLIRCKPIICLEQNGSENKWRGAKVNEAMDFLISLGMKVEKQLNYQDYLLIW